MSKRCITCNLNKNDQEFYKVGNICKICKTIYAKQYILENEEKVKEARRKYYAKNKERQKLYAILNKEKIADRRKIYLKANKEKIKARVRASLATEKGRESKRRQDRLWSRKKRANDINFRLTLNIRNRTKNALKWGSKGGSAVADLGLSIPEYKVYLESKFIEGMNWENYGHGSGKWTIDHVQPLSKFDLSKREEFLIACHYTNTQPMWYSDNIKKSNT